MTKDYIRGNLSAFTADIAVAKAYNLSYILGETNSYARHVSGNSLLLSRICHIIYRCPDFQGAPGISNSAGAQI